MSFKFLIDDHVYKLTRLLWLTDTLSVSSKALALSMPSYISQCRILLSTSSSLAHPSLDTHPSHAWKHSREAYLSWVTDRVLEVSSNSGDLKEERMDAVGSASDARVS